MNECEAKMTMFQIWYMRPEWFTNGTFGEIPDPKNLSKTHIHLKDLELQGGMAQLERVFHDMQGEVWSPEGEARELIRSKGLKHTSMSVGDVVVVEGKTFLVANVGFEELSS